MYVDVREDYSAEWRRYVFGEGILKNVVYDNSLAVLHHENGTDRHAFTKEQSVQSEENTSDSNQKSFDEHIQQYSQ